MSGNFSYGVMGEGAARQSSSRKIEKGLKRLFIFTGIVLFAQFIWFFVITPFIPFSRLEIRSFDGFDGVDVLAAAGIMEGSSFISVNVRDAQQRLAAHPLVESARVIKRFPDRLSIFLEPRMAVAVSLADFDGRQLPVLIDRHGVIFQIGGIQETGAVLPVISGLTFQNPAPGMRLPAAFVPLLEDIYRILDTSPELLTAISEIRLNRKAHDDFDLIIFPVHSSIRVRLERQLSENTLRYVLLMLDVLESSFPRPQEIDFRMGIGSYSIKEVRSGQ